MITFKQSGDFSKTTNFMTRARFINLTRILNAYGQQGVNALASATPVESGLTATSWGYTLSISKGISSITWTNSNAPNGIPVAILLQYGHGTRNGGYIQGRDYINPAIRPIFDRITSEVWKEITSL